MFKFIIQVVSLLTLIGLLTLAWAKQSESINQSIPPRGNGLIMNPLNL